VSNIWLLFVGMVLLLILNCDSERVNALKGKTERYKCYRPRKQFGVKVGTIFHNSKIPLRK
jgi:hypothetical protein